jgi:hypothetical protein
MAMQFSNAVQTIIERGKAAYKRRIDRHQEDLNDWWAIGEALSEPERELLHELGLNRPEDGGKVGAGLGRLSPREWLHTYPQDDALPPAVVYGASH